MHGTTRLSLTRTQLCTGVTVGCLAAALLFFGFVSAFCCAFGKLLGVVPCILRPIASQFRHIEIAVLEAVSRSENDGF